MCYSGLVIPQAQGAQLAQQAAQQAYAAEQDVCFDELDEFGWLDSLSEDEGAALGLAPVAPNTSADESAESSQIKMEGEFVGP